MKNYEIKGYYNKRPFLSKFITPPDTLVNLCNIIDIGRTMCCIKTPMEGTHIPWKTTALLLHVRRIRLSVENNMIRA